MKISVEGIGIGTSCGVVMTQYRSGMTPQSLERSLQQIESTELGQSER